jgi:hypothetical protein
MKIFFRPDGTAQCLYGENINLAALGNLDIRRASHVEPDPAQPGKWYIDLAPVGGPATYGYDTRAQALAAEEAWLHQQMREKHVEATGPCPAI